MSTDPDRRDSQDSAATVGPASDTRVGPGDGAGGATPDGGATPADVAPAAADPSRPDAPAAPTPAASGADAWRPDEPAFEARVVRAFIRGGRLTSIPARERKKLVIYRYLLDQVLPDPAEAVAERDLNMRLALWHPDPATIRRAFIDHRLATRDGMTYRRAAPARLGVPPGE